MKRDSPHDFVRFLRIAKGSCGELRTQLYTGVEACFIERSKALEFIDEAAQVARMLQGLIGYYESEKSFLTCTLGT